MDKTSKSPLERIFITYRSLGNVAKPFFHITYNYVNKNGDHHVIEAGPERQDILGALSTSFSQAIKSPQKGFGKLVVLQGKLNDVRTLLKDKGFDSRVLTFAEDGSIEQPVEIFSEGSDLSGQWERMTQVATRIHNKNLPYNPFNLNSNTIAGIIGERVFNRRPSGKAGFLRKDGSVTNKGMITIDDANTETRFFQTPGVNNSFTKKEPKQLFPEKPPLNSSELKPQTIYNPFKRDEDGKSDLLAEAHMMRDEPWLAKKLIRAAGREYFFKHFFEAA